MTDTGATVFMKFLRLTSCDNPEYRAAAELYAQSFPYHEQRESRSQADIMNNKISDESPVGMALKGAKVGEEVLVEAPDGEFMYRVLDIKRQEL